MLTKGGKARRILKYPDGFFKDDFRVLTEKDLAKYLRISDQELSHYQKHTSELTDAMITSLAKLYDDLAGNGVAVSEENDADDIEEKAIELLNNWRNFLDEKGKVLTADKLAELLEVKRLQIFRWKRDYSKIPKAMKSKLAKLYDTLLRVDDIPTPHDDFLQLLRNIRTEDEMFEIVQDEIAEVVKQGLKQTEVTYYTRQVLDIFTEGIKAKQSTLLRIIITKMNENNRN